MTGRGIILTLAVAAIAGLGADVGHAAPSAPMPSTPFVYIFDMGGPGQHCTPAEAIRVDPATVTRSPQTYLGKCIEMRGIASRGRLYADRDAYYRDSPHAGSTGMTEGVVGLYGLRLLDVHLAELTTVDVTGRLHECVPDQPYTWGYCITYAPGRVAVGAQTIEDLDERSLVSVNDLGPLGDTWSMSGPSFVDGTLYHRSAREVVAIGRGH